MVPLFLGGLPWGAGRFSGFFADFAVKLCGVLEFLMLQIRVSGWEVNVSIMIFYL